MIRPPWHTQSVLHNISPSASRANNMMIAQETHTETCVLEMVGFAFFVFFSRELFGTSSLGHPESISSVGTKKSCTHVWHGPF